MIALNGLRKSFRATPAGDAVSFTVDNGMVTGLPGPNGAGKTTRLRLLTGLLRPDAGSVHVMQEVSGLCDRIVVLARGRVVPGSDRRLQPLTHEETQDSTRPDGWTSEATEKPAKRRKTASHRTSHYANLVTRN